MKKVVLVALFCGGSMFRAHAALRSFDLSGTLFASVLAAVGLNVLDTYTRPLCQTQDRVGSGDLSESEDNLNEKEIQKRFEALPVA